MGFAHVIGQFLIHYGWRGTFFQYLRDHGYLQFLIHYGWRGTMAKPWQTMTTQCF